MIIRYGTSNITTYFSRQRIFFVLGLNVSYLVSNKDIQTRDSNIILWLVTMNPTFFLHEYRMHFPGFMTGVCMCRSIYLFITVAIWFDFVFHQGLFSVKILLIFSRELIFLTFTKEKAIILLKLNCSLRILWSSNIKQTFCNM